MKWHYDLTQAEPIIRDLPVGGASDIQLGAVVARDGAITTPLNRMCFQNAAAAVVDDVVGVAAEFYDYSEHKNNIGTNAATAAATGVTNYIKVIINPKAIWLAEYSQHADNDDALASGAWTVNPPTAVANRRWTATGTIVTDREGDWLYVSNVGSSAGAAGSLYMIGASNTTASVDPVSTSAFYTGLTKLAIVGDTAIMISSPYQPMAAGGSIDLSAATGEVGTKLKGVVTAGTGAILPIANYIQDSSTPMEPLRVERHSGRIFDPKSAVLSADVFLLDHILNGGGIATAPQVA